MKIRCRLLTLKIRLFTVFSGWKTTFVKIGHRKDYRADYLRKVRYLHVDSFFFIRLSCRLLSLKI